MIKSRSDYPRRGAPGPFMVVVSTKFAERSQEAILHCARRINSLLNFTALQTQRKRLRPNRHRLKLRESSQNAAALNRMIVEGASRAKSRPGPASSARVPAT
jgi:hypothetical protein